MLPAPPSSRVIRGQCTHQRPPIHVSGCNGRPVLPRVCWRISHHLPASGNIASFLPLTHEGQLICEWDIPLYSARTYCSSMSRFFSCGEAATMYTYPFKMLCPRQDLVSCGTLPDYDSRASRVACLFRAFQNTALWLVKRPVEPMSTHSVCSA